MTTHDFIVIGASAGGVEALKQLVSQLPADLPATICVVLHLPPYSTSVLPGILSRGGRLPAVHPINGQVLEHGHIYVAPPDNHLIVKAGHVVLTRGPKENRSRPAIDALFRSAARAYGKRVIAIILSGVLDDGTAGLLAVKSEGGVSIVQDPKEAMYAGMPQSAIENDHVDYILPLSKIADLLNTLTREPISEAPTPLVDSTNGLEIDIAEMEQDIQATPPGEPAVFACPECGGTLWEVQDRDLIRFRCRIGHAFTAHSLLAQQADSLENAFWVALRALEERAALAHRMADRADQQNQQHNSRIFNDQAQNAEENAKLIRTVLQEGIVGRTEKVPD
ncbi:MAG: chemotaxis protein CheB [Aggregatilineales bacterium]